MATTYTPAQFPRRPKQPTLFSEARYQCQLWYYRYEVNTPLYVMSEGEKLVFNLVVLSFLTLLLYASGYFLPGTVVRLARRLSHYLVGDQHKSMVGDGVEIVRGILQHAATYEPVASLTRNGSFALAT